MDAEEPGWVTVGKVRDVPTNSLRRFDVAGREVSVVNQGGKFYGILDRCGHMNAPLSRGKISDVQGRVIVTCPLHGSTFDVGSGKNLSGPVKAAPLNLQGVAPAIQTVLAKAVEYSGLIRVTDLPIFPVRVMGDDLQVKVE